MTKQELKVLQKIKKKCENTEECSICEYYDLAFRCIFNRDMPMDWVIDEELD